MGVVRGFASHLLLATTYYYLLLLTTTYYYGRGVVRGLASLFEEVAALETDGVERSVNGQVCRLS